MDFHNHSIILDQAMNIHNVAPSYAPRLSYTTTLSWTKKATARVKANPELSTDQQRILLSTLQKIRTRIEGLALETPDPYLIGFNLHLRLLSNSTIASYLNDFALANGITNLNLPRP